MLEVRNRQRFPLPRASGRCGFGEVTFAGTHGNDEDAPIPAVHGLEIELPGSTLKSHSWSPLADGRVDKSGRSPGTLHLRAHLGAAAQSRLVLCPCSR
jgi:hypothetical protein